MRRADICLCLGPAARAELEALTTNRNTPRKLVWRAQIVLATADGQGTFEIMGRAGISRPTVWRWQQRYLDQGVAGLKRDQTRPSRVPPPRPGVKFDLDHGGATLLLHAEPTGQE
jgi:hypothetical protein